MALYEIKVHYQRQTGEDTPGKVKETYIVEGINCSDVENRLLRELKPFISGDHEVVSCKQVRIYDIFPKEDGHFWFQARVELITIDGDKEIRRVVSVLIQDVSIAEALKNLNIQLSAIDFELISLAKSPIMDVINATK